jgi:hypothetical protein
MAFPEDEQRLDDDVGAPGSTRASAACGHPTRWINTTKQERADAEKESGRGPGAVPVSRQEIADRLDSLGGLVEVIVHAESGDKADLYRELGLRLTYRPQKQLVKARLIPSLHMCKRYVSEAGHEPNAHAFVLSRSFLLGDR